MIPRKVAKSGISMRFESRPTTIEPAAIPARATPIGRPMASTEPKATTRITMAKAMPRASVEGSSNSA